MFNFFRKYSMLYTEEDILIKFVNNTDSVLVVGPFLEYGYESSLPILLKKINNTNLTIIDIQGEGIKAPKFNKFYVTGEGDIFKTRSSINKVLTVPLNFVLSDALNLPFRPETFDVIIDRVTHEFITKIMAFSFFYYDKGKMDKLVFEYNKVLKRNGKIIFLSVHWSTQRKLTEALNIWGYKIIKGKLKKIRRIKLENESHKPVHVPRDYVIAIKT